MLKAVPGCPGMRPPASEGGTSEDLPACHLPLECSSSAAAPHHPCCTMSCSPPGSWCRARGGVVPQLLGCTFTFRKGLPGPWCLHREQQWGQGRARIVRTWLESWGCFVSAWGCPDFRELLESKQLVLAQSPLKGPGGDKRCKLVSTVA